MTRLLFPEEGSALCDGASGSELSKISSVAPRPSSLSLLSPLATRLASHFHTSTSRPFLHTASTPASSPAASTNNGSTQNDQLSISPHQLQLHRGKAQAAESYAYGTFLIVHTIIIHLIMPSTRRSAVEIDATDPYMYARHLLRSTFPLLLYTSPDTHMQRPPAQEVSLRAPTKGRATRRS